MVWPGQAQLFAVHLNLHLRCYASWPGSCIRSGLAIALADVHAILSEVHFACQQQTMLRGQQAATRQAYGHPQTLTICLRRGENSISQIPSGASMLEIHR